MRRPGRRAHLVALTIELIAVATLAGFGEEFPRDATAGSAWSFLGSHGFATAHAALGALVLLQTMVLLVTSRGSAIAVVLAAGVATAVASGVAYVSAGQADLPLTLMTAGWLVGLVAAVVGIVRGRRGSVRQAD